MGIFGALVLNILIYKVIGRMTLMVTSNWHGNSYIKLEYKIFKILVYYISRGCHENIL